MKNEIIEKLKEYDIKSVDEFTPHFYTQNLQMGYKIEQQAIKNLYDKGFTNEELILIDNYNDIGIVEYVAKNNFYIENNHIFIEE